MACAWFVFVSVFSILSAATCRAKTADEAELEAERGVDGASGSATGVIPAGMPIAVPTCSRDDEFLTSNGTNLLCRRIPPLTCFVDSVEPEPDSPIPLPPTGCTVYEPPLRGAIACHLNTSQTLMYCHIYCDHNFEFLTTPHNPYSCGPSTDFQWLDVTGRESTFPECTAHRTTIGTIHGLSNYLPTPCYGLSDNSILAIMDEFRGILREELRVIAEPEDIFMRCPSFDGRVYLYNEVSVRATHKRKKREGTENSRPNE